MTLLELLRKGSEAASGLVTFLERVKVEDPDLAPAADEWLMTLNEAVSQANLIVVAKALPEEIANITQGNLDPKDHPSDAI